MHIYDQKKNLLNKNLEVVNYKSADAHIEINSDYGYKPSIKRKLRA